MTTLVTVPAGLFVLAVFSGMLRLSVAFAAVPFLSSFLPDLMHQAQPLSSFLGACVTSLWVPDARLKQLFGILIVGMTGYKIRTSWG